MAPKGGAARGGAKATKVKTKAKAKAEAKSKVAKKALRTQSAQGATRGRGRGPGRGGKATQKEESLTPEDAVAEAFMRSAAASALAGVRLEHGGPFGASIVRNGVLIACAHNMVLHCQDPTRHAEMTAISQACKAIGSICPSVISTRHASHVQCVGERYSGRAWAGSTSV